MWILTKVKTTVASANADYKQWDIAIAFRNFYGDHTGAAQGTITRAVLNEYETSQKFNCFVGDNATNNNRELIQSLNLHSKINIMANNCTRGVGHIINLVVKASSPAARTNGSNASGRLTSTLKRFTPTSTLQTRGRDRY
jgi:hypothetical protein